MGGKKKTKWRKLPLAEFTKECPTPPAVSKNESKQESSKDEETPPPISYYEELAVNTNQYNEYGEYSDVSNMLYPTSYIVYNPMEMPVYPSYVVPPDACCYYYVPPEIPPVQEYAPVPYQEYIPPVKDTVYLLLPAPAIRSSHGSSHVAYDWRNRRRRRRYEGYAEYAVIPEKTNNSANREEKDRSKKLGSYANASQNDNQSNQTKTMTSFTEPNSFIREGQKRLQEPNEKNFIVSGEQVQTTKNVVLSQVERNEIVQDIQNLKPRKNQEICGVHIARTSDKKIVQNNSDVNFQEKQSKPKNSEWGSEDSVPSTKELMELHKKVQEIKESKEVNDKPKCQDLTNQRQISKEKEKTQEKNVNNVAGMDLNSQKTDLNFSKFPDNSLHDSDKDTEEKNMMISVQNSDSEAMTASLSDNVLKVSDNVNHQSKSETEKHSSHNPNEAESSSPLPDILSTLHKTVPSNPKTINKEISKNDKLSESPLFDKISLSDEKFPKSKVILSQSPYISHSLNSDTSSHDTEAELKRLTNLQSLRANQSIYKLAYDESITDQSEADSRSPSPVDPETQVPRSIINDEILIHEADSCSDAGSEDVELIPHRYESETFLNENKHMYVNKLSLAVELLRTQESLPYDEQFKRVSGESNLNLKETGPNAIGEVNLGFVEDSSSFESFEDHIDSRIPGPSQNVITSQSQTSKNSRNSAAISSFSFEDACNESCEEAKEVVVEAANTRDDSEGVRAGYRRFQVQFRHYFTPRAALVNPCLCCIIM